MVILTIIVTGILFTYPYMLRNYNDRIEYIEAETKVEQESIQNEIKKGFMDVLYRSNYSLYADIVQKNKGKTMEPAEIFLTAYNNNQGIQTDDGSEENSNDTQTDEGSEGNYDDTQTGVGSEENSNEDQIRNQLEHLAGVTSEESEGDGDYNKSNQITIEPDENYDTQVYILNDIVWNFNNLINNWRSYFYSSDVNTYELEYYIIDNETNNYLTNTNKPLEDLKNQDGLAKDLQSYYSFYAVFEYDQNGTVQIPVFNGLEEDKKEFYIERDLSKQILRDESDSSYWYQYGNQIQGPTNVTIIYGVKSEDFYNGNGYDFADYYFYSQIQAFENGGFLLVFLVAIAIMFLISIIITGKKKSGIANISSVIPGEIGFIGILIPFMSYESLLAMVMETVTGGYEISQAIHEDVEKWIIYGTNFIVWMAVLFVFLISITSLLQIFRVGMIRYIKERTIFGWVFKKLKRFLISLMDIDLTDPSNKAIIKILLVNFVVLTILCSIWIAGIFVLIVYSVILFFIIRKYVTNIRQQYQVLVNATSKMAEGNLEVEIDKDLGIFNPLKDELSKVQYGFKWAVAEEMKSQKMKTELITNVSHDLKTPLTAIITYINLLKDENISEEDRKSYIDTLDKKSMRLKGLIEDLFEMSKANSDTIHLNLVEVDIVSLIKQVELELDDKIAEYKVEFRNRFQSEKVILQLDSEKTYRIFENLIVNMMKYSLPYTRAYVELSENDTEVVISLKNVSATELDFSTDDITERFVRGDKSRNTEGSGLGLAIVKSFVELQGGKMEISLDGDLFKVNIIFKK